VFEKLYQSVKGGQETREVIRDCSGKNYQAYLAAKLAEIHDSEMWQAGAAVRALRPGGKPQAPAKGVKGVGGRGRN